MASGRLLSKIDTIKARIGVLPVAASMMERLQAIEETIPFIV
jgi:GTP1/Obg family GTP-binding protein